MDKMYYILIGVIVLVVAIDLYLKKKNKKSDSTDVDSYSNIKKKKKRNYFNILLYVFLFSIICSVVYLHIQHQSIRNQFETNLKSVAEILQENKYDYCDSLVTQNKQDLINNSKANNLKYKLNGTYYNSSDLIYSADSLIELIDVLKKDYAVEEEKRKKREQERNKRKEINSLIDSFIKNKDTKFGRGYSAYRLSERSGYESFKLLEFDLFPFLYKILKLDNKNKFALFHLGEMNAILAKSILFDPSNRKLCFDLIAKAEVYGKKLIELYPKYWGGDKILYDVNHVEYELSEVSQNELTYARIMRSYSTNIIEKIGEPKNNWEKAVLFITYNNRANCNDILSDYRALYYDALYISNFGETFVDHNKYIESKPYANGVSGRYRNYGSAWDPNDYQDYK